MYGLTKEQMDIMKEYGFPFHGTREEQKQFLYRCVKNVHTDNYDKLSEEQKIKAKDEMICISTILKAFKNEDRQKLDAEADIENPEQTTFNDFMKAFYTFFDGIFSRKLRYVELGEPTDINNLGKFECAYLLEHDEDGIIYQRVDGSKFSIRYEGSKDDFGLEMYRCVDENLKEPVFIYTEMGVGDILNVVHNNINGYNFFTNVFLSTERLERICKTGFLRIRDRDGAIDKDSVLGNDYAGRIERSVEDGTEEPYSNKNIKANPRTALMLWAEYLHDESRINNEVAHDYITFLRVKEQAEDNEDPQELHFEVAFYLKYIEAVQLDDDKKSTIYSYSYKKSKNSEDMIIYTENNPEWLLEIISSGDDAYDCFVETFLSDGRIQQVVEPKSIESYDENDESFIGNGYAGFIDNYHSAYEIKSDKSILEAIAKKIRRKESGMQELDG